MNKFYILPLDESHSKEIFTLQEKIFEILDLIFGELKS